MNFKFHSVKTESDVSQKSKAITVTSGERKWRKNDLKHSSKSPEIQSKN